MSVILAFRIFQRKEIRIYFRDGICPTIPDIDDAKRLFIGNCFLYRIEDKKRNKRGDMDVPNSLPILYFSLV